MEENKNYPVDISKLSEDLRKKDLEKIKRCRAKDLQPFLDYSEWKCFEQISQKVIEHCKSSYFNRAQYLLKLHEWTNVLENLETTALKTLCKTALQYHLDLISKQLAFRVSKIQTQPKIYFSLHELLTQRAKYSTYETRVRCEKEGV